MAEIIQLSDRCPIRTACTEPFDMDATWQFSAGPNAKVTSKPVGIPEPDRPIIERVARKLRSVIGRS